ncbi:hypothetical protein BB561_005945 [Smittium simulii]|uniref:ATP synthase subunit 4 n=1 Tax=Smittium simulii TaxID=133385 RepID=A0A2T9Y7F2_9FUNG|nr:hypothetical protein BB561_005945 [Smittium simulii]
MSVQSLSRFALANVSKAKFISPRVSAAVFSRSMSTEHQDPAAKAHSLIDMLPGDNFVTKTGYIAATTGATAFLISKEIYVFNEESIIVAALAGMLTLLYSKMREPLNSWAKDYSTSLETILNKARGEHKAAVISKVDSLSQLKEIVPMTKNMFALSREMVVMLSEINELKQKIAIRNEVKAVLDSHVRYEESVRQNEQRVVASKVITNIRNQLTNPKVQQEIINQCLVDLKGLKVTNV